jgi:hypothetical protein
MLQSLLRRFAGASNSGRRKVGVRCSRHNHLRATRFEALESRALMHGVSFVDLPPLVEDNHAAPIFLDTARPPADVPKPLDGKIPDALGNIIENIAAAVANGTFQLQPGSREEASVALNASIEYHLNKAGELHCMLALATGIHRSFGPSRRSGFEL